MSSPRRIFRPQENLVAASYNYYQGPSNHQEPSNPPAKKTKLDEDGADTQSPPKACKTAFELFIESKADEIAELHGTRNKDKRILYASKMWNDLSGNERAKWDEVEREDKRRYEREKRDFKGKWAVKKRRRKKDPNAPKRPMSAFLAYSQKMRPVVKEENPELKNQNVSQILGVMWKTAPNREEFIEKEKIERAKYNREIAKYRAKEASRDAASRTSHQAVQKLANYQPQHTHNQSYYPTTAAAGSETTDPYRSANHGNSYYSMVQNPRAATARYGNAIVDPEQAYGMDHSVYTLSGNENGNMGRDQHSFYTQNRSAFFHSLEHSAAPYTTLNHHLPIISPPLPPPQMGGEDADYTYDGESQKSLYHQSSVTNKNESRKSIYRQSPVANNENENKNSVYRQSPVNNEDENRNSIYRQSPINNEDEYIPEDWRSQYEAEDMAAPSFHGDLTNDHFQL